LNKQSRAMQRRRVLPFYFRVMFVASLAIVAQARLQAAGADNAAKPSPLIPAMKAELERSMKALGA